MRSNTTIVSFTREADDREDCRDKQGVHLNSDDVAQQGEESQQEQGVVQKGSNGGEAQYDRSFHAAEGPHDVEENEHRRHRDRDSRRAGEFSAHNRANGGEAEFLAGSSLLNNGGDQRVLGFDLQGRGAHQGSVVFGQLDRCPRVAAVKSGRLDGLLGDRLVEAQPDQRAAGEVDTGFEAAGQQRDDAGQQQRQRQQIPPAAAGTLWRT